MILSALSVAVVGLAIHQATKGIGFKPFNCELCMVFHVSWIVFALGCFFPIAYEVVTYVGIAIFTRQLLYRIWPTMF